jgi:hypothetical protein
MEFTAILQTAEYAISDGVASGNGLCTRRHPVAAALSTVGQATPNTNAR